MESESRPFSTAELHSLPLTCDRVEFLLDLMRDIGAYVESKDFELGLPITNFQGPIV